LPGRPANRGGITPWATVAASPHGPAAQHHPTRAGCSVGADDSVIGDGVCGRPGGVDRHGPSCRHCRHGDRHAGQQHPPPRVPDCHRCHDYLREWRPARHLAQDGPAGLTTVAKTVEKRQGRTIGGMGMPANYESAICAACPHQRFTHQRCRRQHPQAMTTAGAKSHTGTAGLPWGPEPRSGSHEQGKGVRPGALRARAGCSMAGRGADVVAGLGDGCRKEGGSHHGPGRLSVV
jgi:hypothetical protein